MKRLLSVVFATCAPLVLAFTLASQVAMACDIAIAELGDDDNAVFCYLTGEDADWCYYMCYCSTSGTDCSKIYDLLGLIDA